MKVTVLIDNLTRSELHAEWGLSMLIEHRDRRILLDAGTTDFFSANAASLAVDLSTVDTAVLSHAHFDHADGMDAFFALNQRAEFWLREGCEENCYTPEDGAMKYIGIRQGNLEKYADRIRYAKGDVDLGDGIWLIPHKTEGLEVLAAAAGMMVLKDGAYVPDDFCHEQSLVFRTEKGLVIFNSCSHGGADNIITEVAKTFPGEKLYAMIGGFHLFKTPEDEVRAFAKRLLETGVGKVVTGHCTGDAAYEILHEELGDKVQQMYSGLTLEL